MTCIFVVCIDATTDQKKCEFGGKVWGGSNETKDTICRLSSSHAHTGKMCVPCVRLFLSLPLALGLLKKIIAFRLSIYIYMEVDVYNVRFFCVVRTNYFSQNIAHLNTRAAGD